jgi:hypothetical protein
MIFPHEFGAVFLLATDVASKPVNPLGFGGIVAWIICAKRKDRSIGGWLLFYYWQIFAGAVFAAFLLTTVGYANYIPEVHNRPLDFWLFFISAMPSVALLWVQAGAALMLLCVRTWDALQLLRYILVASAAFEWIAVTIDAYKFQQNLPISSMGAVQMTAWMIYFFASKRVQRVFKYDDWELPASTPTSTLGLT